MRRKIETISATKHPPITITRSDYLRLLDLAWAARARSPEVGEFLLEEIDRAQIVEPQAIPRSVVTMGAMVDFRDDHTGQERRVTLVYPGEQDIELGRISVLTPIGAALIGLAEGQSIAFRTPAGEERSLTVLRVTQP
ncbi:nucleoside diphosphate kinase regulator [Benzoatithermus flavus]|uniref:Nucleoside diphosphate kinase regulator n=1 Tax=Benzoatithermus flavus TaxID=3108223 RepID=A0ABU8XW10_9PROT